MESEKVQEIKKVLEEGQFNTINHHQKEGKPIKISFADILTLINELESENKELRVVVDIANERTYRKKFTDEWRKEHQKELDKQGNGHIAGHPDFDLVYKLYFEQKDRIAELENENKDYYDRLNNLQTYIDNHEEIWKGNTNNALKQFAERLKEHPTMKIYSLHNACERIPKAIDETLKEYEK